MPRTPAPGHNWLRLFGSQGRWKHTHDSGCFLQWRSSSFSRTSGRAGKHGARGFEKRGWPREVGILALGGQDVTEYIECQVDPCAPYLDKWMRITSSCTRIFADCDRHERPCPIPTSDLDISSWPCTDFSSSGTPSQRQPRDQLGYGAKL